MSNVPSTVGNSLAHFSQGVFTWDDKRIGYLSAEKISESLRQRLG